MSRPLRLDFANAIHHVTSRGNAREHVYRDVADRVRWLEALAQTVERFDWVVLAYCQLGNHYHLLLETPRANLSRGMRQLNGTYAQRFNRRHGRVGHVFQARFHAALVARDAHLLALAAYLPVNPVRAGLCAEPEEWSWSSYRATLGLEPPGLVAADRLLAHFGDTRERARERYRAHVREQLLRELLPCEGAPYVGDARFVAEHTRGLEPMGEVPRAHWRPLRAPLGELMRDRSDAAIASAYREHGYSMREIAAELGVHYATVSRRLRRHETQGSDCKT